MLPCLSDNYIFLFKLIDEEYWIVVDPGDSQPVLDFLHEKSSNLNEIWITHSHFDHVGGIAELRRVFNPILRGPSSFISASLFADATTEKFDIENDKIEMINWKKKNSIQVLKLPGHTLDHIGYWISDKDTSILFSWDVLFGLGCGRVFDGTYEQHAKKKKKIFHLPNHTRIFCTHEYTEINLDFSLEQEPLNESILEYEKKVKSKRSDGKATVPLILSEEKSANLFLKHLLQHSNDKNIDIIKFRALRDKRNLFVKKS